MRTLRLCIGRLRTVSGGKKQCGHAQLIAPLWDDVIVRASATDLASYLRRPHLQLGRVEPVEPSRGNRHLQRISYRFECGIRELRNGLKVTSRPRTSKSKRRMENVPPVWKRLVRTAGRVMVRYGRLWFCSTRRRLL